MKDNDPRPPIEFFMNKYLGGFNFNKSLLFFSGHCPRVLVCDPKIVEALYTTQNSFFDKHPHIKNLQMSILGRSILL